MRPQLMSPPSSQKTTVRHFAALEKQGSAVSAPYRNFRLSRAEFHFGLSDTGIPTAAHIDIYSHDFERLSDKQPAPCSNSCLDCG